MIKKEKQSKLKKKYLIIKLKEMNMDLLNEFQIGNCKIKSKT